MKKQWWQYFSFVAGAAFIFGFTALNRNYDIAGGVSIGIGVVATIIYFFNQQKEA